MSDIAAQIAAVREVITRYGPADHDAPDHLYDGMCGTLRTLEAVERWSALFADHGYTTQEHDEAFYHAVQGHGWQPIDNSMAKDGHRLLLAGNTDGIPWIAIGHWSPMDGEWQDDVSATILRPTHYGRLPAPPRGDRDDRS